MSKVIISNVRIMQPGQGIIGSALLICDGLIATVDPTGAEIGNADEFDGGGRLLTPGLIDVHTHGVGQYFFEADPEQLVAGVSRFAMYGATTVLPTLYRVMNKESLPHLEKLAGALSDCHDVNAPGFHLEGPFLALPGAGAQTVGGDVTLLEELLAATQGKVAAMSISPETPNIIPVIERLVEHRIAVFITHTRGSVEQTQVAIDAGARHATHFYDVFPIPQETEPGARPCGAVETILADGRVSVDFIADGVHVDPIAIKASLAAKGYQKILLITDSNIGAGLPAGVYETGWGYPVKVQPGDAARIHDPEHPFHGALAGSALTMNVGMANLLGWLDIPQEQAWAMGTSNVAALLGWTDRGIIRQGAQADLVLWEQTKNTLQAMRTWVGGRCIFDESLTAKESVS